MICLTDTAFSPSKELEAFTAGAPDAGAIVSFSGHVRPLSAKGDVLTLHLQAYSPMTDNGIQTAADTANARWNLLGLCIIHRIGDMSPGEPIVFVATASAHRRDAFEAADFLMDYLKTDAVFWKKETRSDGSEWIEPRQQDYADAERWKKPKEPTDGRD